MLRVDGRTTAGRNSSHAGTLRAKRFRQLPGAAGVKFVFPDRNGDTILFDPQHAAKCHEFEGASSAQQCRPQNRDFDTASDLQTRRLCPKQHPSATEVDCVAGAFLQRSLLPVLDLVSQLLLYSVAPGPAPFGRSIRRAIRLHYFMIGAAPRAGQWYDRFITYCNNPQYLEQGYAWGSNFRRDIPS